MIFRRLDTWGEWVPCSPHACHVRLFSPPQLCQVASDFEKHAVPCVGVTKPFEYTG
jgi:hypothetical protein